MVEVAVLMFLAIALLRWRYWKNEAYRTRDAAIAGFLMIEEAVRDASGCPDCGRAKGCTDQCEDMNCDHCYCNREGRDG
jgi:hypothetical protein